MTYFPFFSLTSNLPPPLTHQQTPMKKRKTFDLPPLRSKPSQNNCPPPGGQFGRFPCTTLLLPYYILYLSLLVTSLHTTMLLPLLLRYCCCCSRVHTYWLRVLVSTYILTRSIIILKTCHKTVRAGRTHKDSMISTKSIPACDILFKRNLA